MGNRICSAEDCEQPVGDKGARGLCSSHYSSWRRCGYPPADPLRYKRWAGRAVPKCTVVLLSGELCGRPHEGNGYCSAHNQRFKKHGDVLADKPIGPWGSQGCSIPGCPEEQHYARGWCLRHYQLWKTNGDPTTQYWASPGEADYYSHGYHFIHADGRIIAEHRWVMEQALGRALLPGENVHHRDTDRANNDIDNLELWVTHQPKGQRVADLLSFVAERYPEQIMALIRAQGELSA